MKKKANLMMWNFAFFVTIIVLECAGLAFHDFLLTDAGIVVLLVHVTFAITMWNKT